MNKRALLLGGLLILVTTVAVRGEPSVNVDIEIQEPVGVARKGEPVTSGVPLPKGFDSLDKLVLKDASGNPLPCQFSPLGKRADSKPYWVLLDFQADIPAKKKVTFKLASTGDNPKPGTAVKIDDSKKRITVDTGPLKFEISKKHFNFLDTVWLDGDKVLEPGKTPVFRIVEGAADTRLDSRGVPPHRVELEYAGPMRACIRVDGTYTKDDTYYLHYTLRIEAFAGKPDLRVNWKLRNSQKFWAFNAYVKEASLDTKLLTGGSVIKPGDVKKDGWIAVSGEKASLAVVNRFSRYHRHAGISAQPDGTLSFKPFASPGWIEKHMEYEWQLLYRFKKGKLTPADAQAMATQLRSRLIALAPGKWYQQCDALGGPIGMLEDEINTYKAWGWTINEKGKPRPTGTRFLNTLDVHDTSETDSARDNLWQYIRTRNRAFFEIGEAYALYFRNPYTVHWDEGFDPDKLVPGKELDRTPFPRIRRNAARMKKLRRTRMCICHSYYAGLVDHYLMTGELASLESAEHFGQFSEDQYKTRIAGKHNPNGGRYFGRPFQNICRLYEVTRKDRWKALMTKMARIALEAPARDERGLIAGARAASEWNKFAAERGGRKLIGDLSDNKGISCEPIPTKGWSSWELSIFNHSIGRYYDLTGDEDARDMLIAQAWFMVKYAMEPVHKYTGYICVLDFPRKGDAYIPGMSGVPHPPSCVHNGWYTRACPDNCTRGYRLTGRKEFLEMARMYWDRGSKMGYRQPESRRPPDNQSGSFATSRDSKDGCLMYVKELFYVWLNQKKDAEPPAPVKISAKALGKGKVELKWKAPRDNSGKAAAYQVKWAKMPIKTYEKYNYREDEGKIRCWWRTQNVKGEPTPGKPGTKEKYVVEGLEPGTCWFAIRSDDAEMNQSDISNVVKVEVK